MGKRNNIRPFLRGNGFLLPCNKIRLLSIVLSKCEKSLKNIGSQPQFLQNVSFWQKVCFGYHFGNRKRRRRRGIPLGLGRENGKSSLSSSFPSVACGRHICQNGGRSGSIEKGGKTSSCGVRTLAHHSENMRQGGERKRRKGKLTGGGGGVFTGEKRGLWKE